MAQTIFRNLERDGVRDQLFTSESLKSSIATLKTSISSYFKTCRTDCEAIRIKCKTVNDLIGAHNGSEIIAQGPLMVCTVYMLLEIIADFEALRNVAIDTPQQDTQKVLQTLLSEIQALKADRDTLLKHIDQGAKHEVTLAELEKAQHDNVHLSERLATLERESAVSKAERATSEKMRSAMDILDLMPLGASPTPDADDDDASATRAEPAIGIDEIPETQVDDDVVAAIVDDDEPDKHVDGV